MSIFVELADNETSGCSGFVWVIGILLTLESIFNGGGKTMQGNMSLSSVMVRRKNRASSTLIESPLYGFYPFFQVFDLFMLEDILDYVVAGQALQPVFRPFCVKR
jgi:hypothetical protein